MSKASSKSKVSAKLWDKEGNNTDHVQKDHLVGYGTCSTDALRNILSTALRIRSACKTTTCGSYPPFTPNSSPLNIVCELPPPGSIASLLTSSGVPHGVAEKLSGAFLRTAERYRDFVSQEFLKACAKGSFSDDVLRQLSASFNKMYTSKLKIWTQQTLDKSVAFCKHDTPDENSSQGKKTKKDFNHEYVPLLESYFLENQRPSKADKMFLAKKSGMTYRQIVVWFQNKRRRTRSDIQDLKETPRVNLTSHRHVADTHERTSDEHERTDVEDSLDSNHEYAFRSSPNSADNDTVFIRPAPPHAFPVPYPPELGPDVDPFPCRFGDFSKFSEVKWERTPATELKHLEVMNVDTLIASFEKLSISGTLTTIDVERPCLSMDSLSLWKGSGGCVNGPYTTRPLRAPLFSLIRNPTRDPGTILACVFNDHKVAIRDLPHNDASFGPQHHTTSKAGSSSPRFRQSLVMATAANAAISSPSSTSSVLLSHVPAFLQMSAKPKVSRKPSPVGAHSLTQFAPPPSLPSSHPRNHGLPQSSTARSFPGGDRDLPSSLSRVRSRGDSGSITKKLFSDRTPAPQMTAADSPSPSSFSTSSAAFTTSLAATCYDSDDSLPSLLFSSSSSSVSSETHSPIIPVRSVFAESSPSVLDTSSSLMMPRTESPLYDFSPPISPSIDFSFEFSKAYGCTFARTPFVL
ncbi:hypothetical protein EW145_g7888 [Phellinidium pouzarii]|uniref:Homeobox domain-containing protein n=1 Tax=Phellinidium pouzarii TaxID=167371 RepID=A0A4S4KCW6_9AGAM|nr:hypothetical protein EW145_g7888 [Phellinidium pouzarii]